jgi:hypothetical protein
MSSASLPSARIQLAQSRTRPLHTIVSRPSTSALSSSQTSFGVNTYPGSRSWASILPRRFQ